VNLKSKAKGVIGRLLPVDLAEKLTEYSIARQEPQVSLAQSTAITPPGATWREVVERGREELWTRALQKIGTPDILFLEFGVWQGYSIDYFSRLNRSPPSRFYGFDSFEGLPEGWRGMSAGHFSTGGQIPVSDDERVRFVKGWFRDSLPGQLDRLVEEARSRALLVHFDADLYSSTLYLLCALTQRFDSFYCVFDEFSGHEMRALHNFMQAFGATCEFYLHVPWRGEPTTAFGKLTMPDRAPATSAGLDAARVAA
jgi:hypothetical protein